MDSKPMYEEIPKPEHEFDHPDEAYLTEEQWLESLQTQHTDGEENSDVPADHQRGE